MPPAHAPRFTPADAESLARDVFGVDAAAEALASYDDQNFRLRGDGGEWVLKIARANMERPHLDAENAAMEQLAALAWPLCPRPLAAADGARIVKARASDGRAHLARLLTWVPGIPMGRARSTQALRQDLGRAMGAIAAGLVGFDHPGLRPHGWDLLDVLRLAPLTRHVRDGARRDLVEHVLLEIEGDAALWARLPRGVIHGDGNDLNVVVTPAGAAVAGVIDFGDLTRSAVAAEAAIAAAYATFNADDPTAAIADVTRGFHAARPLSDDALEALPLMVMGRLVMSLLYSTRDAAARPDNAEYITVSQAGAWRSLHRLACVPHALARAAVRAACGRGADPPTPAALRARHLAPSLSLHYPDAPLRVARGVMSRLYADDGRAYVDLVNNVCHAGHCNPRVVRAGARQMARLNTNTRYVYAGLGRLAARLTATLPDPLSVCVFVCSGSEANELALRMARAHTGRLDALVVEGDYHGNTSALIDLSPYKFDGPGGAGRPAHVAVIPAPDPYRGRHRGPGSGPAYAAEVDGAIAGRAIAAFFCESILGCGGQVVPPPGFMAGAFDRVRAAGGLCVADEVQVGFGRVGTHMWGFQAHGVAPDIVTMGKPMGNGHPIAAVVTTPAIAASFANGMEYFNTFGGNPVSCAAAEAVLDEVQGATGCGAGLMENARVQGAWLLDALRDLARRRRIVGDARGMGLFLGVELVLDHRSLAPAAAEAADAVAALKGAGFLASTDGPLRNVIKIKPPMTLRREDAAAFVEALESALPW